MTAHEQFADDLALYALGTLEREERALLEKHLEECSACRRELEQLRGDMALLALSTSGPRPPERARKRLLSAIAQEPRHMPVPKRRLWWGPLPWLAAAALALIAIVLWRENANLQHRVATLERNSSQLQDQLARAKEVVATLTAPNTQQVTLVAAKTPPQPQGKAFYLRNKGQLIFLANNLPPLPPEKIYELWLIPKTGAPIPAGLFKPDPHGSATVIHPPLSPGVEAKMFAVTLEPESGSHEAPTGPAVIAGAGE